jgi:hypothetical protein
VDEFRATGQLARRLHSERGDAYRAGLVGKRVGNSFLKLLCIEASSVLMQAPMAEHKKSTIQEFLDKHAQIITKVLFIILTTIIMGGSFVLSAPIGLLLYPLVCHFFGCNQEIAMNLFGICSIGGALIVGALCLHALAGVKWLKSFEATSMSFAIVFMAATFAGAIVQQKMPANLLFLEAIVFTTMLIWTTFCLEWSKRWSHLITALFFILYFVSFPVLMNGPIRDLHTVYENQTNTQDAKKLSFKVYTPTYIPRGFWLAAINTTPAAGNLPTSYKLDYSNGSKDAPFGPGIQTITIVEESKAEGENAAAKCLSIGQMANGAPCQPMGEGVYSQERSDDPGYLTAYKEVDGTLVQMWLPKNISKDDTRHIFNSLQQGVAKP